MKRFFKIIAFLTVATIAVIVAGVAILTTQDFNQYRDLIAEQAEAATGRKLTIDGNLELDISLNPAISVEGVTFANANWGSRPEMVRLGKMAAVVELIPLLSGNVQIQWLELSEVDILLETNEAGMGNWVFASGKERAPASDDGPSGSLPVFETVRMRDVSITYRDGAAGTTNSIRFERLTLLAEAPDKPLSLSAKARFNDEDIDVDGTLGSVEALVDNKIFPLNVEIAVLGAKIELDGTINNPHQASNYNIGFAVSGPSLSDLVGRAMPLVGGGDAPPLADSEFSIKGALRDEGPRIAVDGLTVAVGESDLRGRLSLTPGSPRIDLKAEATSNLLRVSDFVDLPESAGDDVPPPDDGRIFPDDPLAVDALTAIDATLGIEIKTFDYDGVVLDDVAANLQLVGGRLILQPFEASYSGNTVGGAAELNAAAEPVTLTFKLAGKGIDYGSLLTQTAGVTTLSGKLDVDVDVASKGVSVRQLMADMNGDLRIVSRDGRIDSSALGFLSSDLLRAVPFLGNQDDARTLKCGVIDFAIVDGIAAPRALLIETGGLNIIGSGAVDLREEKLDLLFDPRAKSTSLVKMAEIGVRVRGTFLEPEIGPDSASVAKNVASTALGIATGGLSTLAEMAFGAAKNAVDDTDYCEVALSGQLPQRKSGTDGAGESTPPKQHGTGGIGSAVEGIGGALDNLFGN